MKAEIEFVGYFISITGRKIFEIDYEDNKATIQDLIIEAEEVMIDRKFEVIKDGELKKGVLVFRRKKNGGMERIYELNTLLNKVGKKIIMTNLMGGG